MQSNIDVEEEFELLESILGDSWDEMDIRIYQILRDRGRMTDTELAEELGTSITTARRRRTKLQEKGHLLVIALLVLQEADLVYTDVLIKISPQGSLKELNDLIEEAIEDIRIYEVTQYVDKKAVLLRFFEQDMQDINKHIHKFLLARDIVEDYEILPAAKTPKAWNRVLSDDEHI